MDLKKLNVLIFISEVVISCTSYADGFLNHGFYLGGKLGYDIPVYRETVGIQNPTFQLNASRTHSGNAGVGGLFAGYGKYFNLFYLGAELFGDGYWGSNKSSADQIQGGIRVMNASERWLNNSYGISAISGIKINTQALFYGRLGFVRGNFSSYLTPFTNVTGPLPPVSSSTNLNGVDYGLGINLDAYKNVVLRGEFKHSDYSGNLVVNRGANFAPSDNMVSMGLLYTFL